eukprot:evm.model.scf_1486.1 EVM.evm.TU.scf_1486.1   scf_1486:393-1145(-)
MALDARSRSAGVELQRPQSCLSSVLNWRSIPSNPFDARRASRHPGMRWVCLRPGMAPVSARPCASRAALADPAADETSAAQCPRGPSWEVHKFGGTCLANPERIREAMRVVVEDPAENKVVVVSAMGSTPESPVKVTDLMLSMIGKAAAQDIGFMTDLTALQEKHVACAKELLGEGPELNQFLGRLMDDVGNLKSMLEAISIGVSRGVAVHALQYIHALRVTGQLREITSAAMRRAHCWYMKAKKPGQQN